MLPHKTFAALNSQKVFSARYVALLAYALTGFVSLTTAAGISYAGQPVPSAEQVAPALPSTATPASGDNQSAQSDKTAAPAEPAKEPAKPLLPDVELIVSGLVSSIDALEKSLERSQNDEADLARLRLEVDGFVDGAALSRNYFEPRLAAIRSQIETLGVLPEKDAAPEAPQVAAERARLASLSAELTGALRTSDLVEERAHQLGDQIQSIRQKLFTGRLLARSLSPVSPKTWKRAATEIPAGGRQIGMIVKSWMKAAKAQLPYLIALLIAVVGLYALLSTIVRRILTQRLDAPRTDQPSFFARAAVASWVAPVLALPAVAAVLVFGFGLNSLDLLVHELEQLAPTILTGLVIFISVSALARAVLAPNRPDWRLVNLADAPARTIARTLAWIAGLYGVDKVLTEVARLVFLPLPVTVLIAAISSLLIALLMVRLVRTPFEPQFVNLPSDPATTADADRPPAPLSRYTPRLLKLPLLAAAVLIIGAVLLGYVALGRFVVEQLIATGSIAALVLLVHLAIRALMGVPGSGVKPLQTILSERAGLSEEQGNAIVSALTLVFDATLALVALPIILLTWGYTILESWSWLKSAIFGFEVGQFKISFARILLAVLLFLALVFLTRLLQRWLKSGVLETAKIDHGIANSIHTAVGYAGFTMAALIAVSYGGLDITNFAIVAGALSVGIGFGLQSIVSNFVSGLILLVERPIKVGDWVSVKGQEGYVRRIAVRSTEIETSDRASLIVPNSDLITSTVTNWTHRNALGRVVIKVGVPYDSDPDRIRAVMQKVAQECQLIMQHPAPTVAFDDFGADALQFSLRAVIPDVSRAGAVQTDLRTRILKAFRTEGIDMSPNPAHDIYLRDLDGIKAIVARIMQERMQAAAEASQPASRPAEQTSPGASSLHPAAAAKPNKE
ncbi:MAG: DUF3772 domain-containing protein [Hyphomicrobium sp.]